MWASSKLGVHEERCDKYSNVTPKKTKKHKQKILPFLFRQLRLRLNTQSYFSFQNLPIQNAFNFNFQLAAHKTAVINFLKKIFYLDVNFYRTVFPDTQHSFSVSTLNSVQLSNPVASKKYVLFQCNVQIL